MKQCTKCLEYKDIEIHFHKNRSYKDKIYINSWCIKCVSDYKKSDRSKEVAKKNRQTEEFKANRKAYRQQPEVKERERLFDLSKREIRREQKRIRHNFRYKNDILYRLTHLCRIRTKELISRNKWTKKNSFARYIGCTKEELKDHIEKQFVTGMTWENQGHDGWHLDHIIPLDSAKTEEELYKLCHYTNLQPLWAKDNLAKSNKLIA